MTVDASCGYIPGTIIVVAREGITDAKLKEVFFLCNCTVIRKLKNIRTYILGVPEGQEESILKKIQKFPEIEAGTLNQKMAAI